MTEKEQYRWRKEKHVDFPCLENQYRWENEKEVYYLDLEEQPENAYLGLRNPVSLRAVLQFDGIKEAAITLVQPRPEGRGGNHFKTFMTSNYNKYGLWLSDESEGGFVKFLENRDKMIFARGLEREEFVKLHHLLYLTEEGIQQEKKEDRFVVRSLLRPLDPFLRVV